MIPGTPEELRDCLRGWPVTDARAAVAEALRGGDPVTVACVVDWLLSEVSGFHPPLGAEQIAAIWEDDVQTTGCIREGGWPPGS